MNIVEKMIEFKNKRQVEILDVSSEYTIDNLIVIITEILSWLKLERKREIWISQGRKTKLKPMELNMNYPWCNDLVMMLQGSNALSVIFCIKGSSMVFKDEIPDDYIHEARRLADEQYNPQMIID